MPTTFDKRKLSNARHHPPADPYVEHDILRVAGRVHAVVRRRDALNYVRWNEEKNLCISASSTLSAGVEMTPSMY